MMVSEDADFHAWLGDFARSLDSPLPDLGEQAVLDLLADRPLVHNQQGGLGSCLAGPDMHAMQAGGLLDAPQQQQQQQQALPPAAHAAPAQQQPELPAKQQRNASGRLKTAGVEYSRRFRQRRKDQVSAMEQEVRDKMAELARLQAQNNELTAKSAALEAMVGASDRNMQVISDKMAAMQVADTAPGSASTTAPADSGTGTSDSSSDVVASTSNGTNGQCSAARGHVQDAVQSMQLDEARVYIKQLVADLSPLLLRLGTGSEDVADVTQQVQVLIEQMTRKMNSFAIGNPQGISQLENLNLATGDPMTAHNCPGEEHWRRVAASLHLSGPTLRNMAAAHRVYREKLAPVMAERQRLLDQISQLGVADCGVDLGVRSACVHRTDQGEATDAALLDLQYEELETRLQRNYMRMHFLIASFMSGCVKAFLSSTQVASLMVHSYPWMPDMEQVLIAALKAAGIPATGQPSLHDS